MSEAPENYQRADGTVVNFKQCNACALTGLIFDSTGDLQPCEECDKGWIEWLDGAPEPQSRPSTKQES